MSSSNKPFRTDMHGNRIEKGDKLICPVCYSEFTVDDDTNYYCAGGYVCKWKCFLTHVKQTQEKKKLEEAAQLELKNAKSQD